MQFLNRLFISSILVFIYVLSARQNASAQSGPCTEQFVKDTITKNPRDSVADDAYFFSGAIDKPVVGKAAMHKAGEPVAAQRANEKYPPLKPDRIVAAASGEMAYEYGTGDVSFDERSSGKHVAFTAAYLRVWRAIDGSCKEAAVMFEPEENH